MSRPFVSFMVPVLNRMRQTRRCLESLAASQGLDFEILVLDNGCDAPSRRVLEIVTNRIRQARLLKADKNLGYTGGMNFMFKRAKGNVLMPVTNDVVLGPDAARQLVETLLSDRGVGMAGPPQMFGYLGADGCGGSRQTVPRHLARLVKGPEYLDGCCYAVRRESIADSETMFHPDYEFMYCEDADLSLRLRSLGLRLVTVPVKFARDESEKTKTVIDVEFYRRKNHNTLIRHWGAYLESRMDPPVPGPPKNMRLFRLPEARHTRTVHLLRCGARGDVLMMTPIARALKRQEPKTKVVIWTQSPDLIRSNYVDHVEVPRHWPPPLTEFGADPYFFLDLAYERKPQQHAVQSYADVVGVTVEDTRPDILVTSEEIDRARRMVGGKQFVLLDYGTSWSNRQYPLESYARVADYIRSVGLAPVAIGVGRQVPDGMLHVTAKSMFDLLGLFPLARAFVGHDGAWMHVAQAFDTPSVLLFSVAAPTTRVTLTSNTRVLERTDLQCLHCLQRRPAPRQFTACDNGAYLGQRVATDECMRIPHERVITALRGVLGGD